MISYCKLGSASGAANYLTAERTDAHAEYYAQENVYSTWGGNGAALAGVLPGQDVEKEDLVRVLEGKISNPATGEIQVLGRPKDGALEHRPGLDLTFSAPKSVSLVGLVGGDERVFAAHEAAVETAMMHLEEQASTRVRLENKGIEYRPTGNLLYAKFQHETSRAMDPQMHTHVAVANATYDHEGGKWRSLEYNSLVRDLKTADAIYKNELASHLNELGYDTKWTKNGPEIEGISRDQVEHFSKRTAAIDKALEAQGLNREEASAARRSAVALETRDKKQHVDRDALDTRWRAEAKSVGLDIDQVVQHAQARTPRSVERGHDSGLDKNAVAAVDKAIRHLAEREQAFSKSDMVREANEFSHGTTSAGEINQAISKAEKSGMLLDRGVDTASGRSMLTTPAAIRAEKLQLAQIREGVGAVSNIMSPSDAGRALDRADADRAYPLDSGQREAATLILTTQDRIVGVQGYAGAGKTTLLETVKQAAESRDFSVLGMSNGAEQAAKLERETGIKSQTVASFLSAIRKENPRLTEKLNSGIRQAKYDLKRAARGGISRIQNYLKGRSAPNAKPIRQLVSAVAKGAVKVLGRSLAKLTQKAEPEAAAKLATTAGTKQVWVVDEASQLAQKDWNALQKAAAEKGARLVFVGDKEQHQSVGAGRAFENAQGGHMKTATLTQIYRQKDEPGQAAVQDLINGRHGEAFDRITSVPGQRVEVRNAVDALTSKYPGKDLTTIKPDELKAARELDSKALAEQTAKVYLAQPNPTESTLIFTATNQSRLEINQAVRGQMKAAGHLVGPEVKVASLVDLKLSDAQKTEAWRYEPGMVVQADRAYRGLGVGRGDQFEVLGHNEKTNTVRIRSAQTGKEMILNPARRTGFTPFTQDAIGMSVGDSVRFTKNAAVEGVNNGSRGTVVNVYTNGITVKADGKEIQIGTDRPLHIQHRYASTTYKDQGNQAAKGIYVIDTTRAGGVGTRDAYVGMTRAVGGTIVVTDDLERARKLVQREQGTTTALDVGQKQTKTRSLGKDQMQPAAKRL